MCMSVCPSVGAFLKDGESDLGQIWLAHAEFIPVESETVAVFLTSPTTTPFPADRTRFRSRAKISGPNLDCPFPTSDGRRRACRYCGRRWEREDNFADIRVLKNTPTVICQSTTVEELPCLMHLFSERQQRLRRDDVQRDCRNDESRYES